MSWRLSRILAAHFARPRQLGGLSRKLDFVSPFVLPSSPFNSRCAGSKSAAAIFMSNDPGRLFGSFGHWQLYDLEAQKVIVHGSLS